jgi:hypothetical protein
MSLSTADFLLEILAVFIGVFAAFLLENYRESVVEKKENTRLFRMLREEILANKGILNGIRNTKAGAVPFGRPMRTVWDGIVNKFDVIREAELFSEVTYLYFVIGSLDRMVNAFADYAAMHRYVTDMQARAGVEEQLKSLREHFTSYIVDECLPQIGRVLKLIDEQLPKDAEKSQDLRSRDNAEENLR